MRANAAALVLFVLLLMVLPAHAQNTWFVRITGSDSANGRTPEAAFRNLSRALSAAQNNDTIVLGAGTFTQDHNVPQRTNLTIRGDPTGALTGDAGVTTLTTTNNTTLHFGSQGSYTVRDLRINRPGGTAVFVANSGTTVNLINVTSQSSQRAVHTQGGTLLLQNVDFSGFTDSAVFAQNSGVVVTIEGSVIGPAAGGSTADGIHNDNATLTVRRSRIRSCAVGVRIKNQPNVTIFNTLLHDHTQDGIVGEGGMINLHHCTIAHNPGNGARSTSSSLRLHSCIVANNGTGLRHEGGLLAMVRGVLHGNTTGWTGNATRNTVATGNPNFANAGARDYTITAGSAAIDQGQVIAGSPTDDFFGIIRAGQGTAPDSGAFERLATTAANVPYTQNFQSPTPAEWSASGRVTNAALGSFSGPFSNSGSGIAGSQQVLTLNVTPGTEYLLRFDLLALQSWDGEVFTVRINGREMFNQQFWCDCNGSNSSLAPRFTTYGPVPALPPSNYMGSGFSWTDQVYRGVWVRFTPTESVIRIVFSSTLNQGWPDEGWGIDNVSVQPLSTPSAPYTSDFSTIPGPEWSSTRMFTTSATGAVAGDFTRTSGGHQESLRLRINATAGVTHYVVFDLLLWDDWAGNGECGCPPDFFEVWANGTRVFNHTMMTAAGDPHAITTTYPRNPDFAGSNIGRTPDQDEIHRRVQIAVTPTTNTLDIHWRGMQRSDLSPRTWSIDNVAIRRATDPELFNTQSPGESLVNSLPRFRDITTAAGWTFNPSTDADGSPSGIHWADFDNDGRLDALIPGNNAPRLLHRSANQKSLLFSALTIPAAGSLSRGAAILDYDRDGRLDFMGFPGGSGNHRFYHNISTGPGNIHFQNANTLGFTGPGNRENAAAADLNGDTRVDIILFDGSGTNFAAINSPGGSVSFTANTSIFPQGAANAGNGDYTSSADVNNDGYPDFFYHYNGGRLFLSSTSSGSGVTYQANSRGISNPSLGNNSLKTGSAWGDFNNDGWVDLWVGSRQAGQRGMLWFNPGPAGDFVDVNNPDAAAAAELKFAGIDDTSGHRGAAWGDYDNDGFLDLAIATASGVRLYRNTGDSTFTLAFEGVSAYGNAMDVCFVDFDADGDLDLAATLANSSLQRLFENVSNLLTPNTNFLSVRLLTRGQSGATNIADARARVELWNAAGTTLLQRRDIGAVRGYAGSEPFIAHFGGIDPTQNYQVHVWHSGQRTDPITVRPLDASTTIAGLTIPQQLTVELSGSRRRLTTWAEVDPLR